MGTKNHNMCRAAGDILGERCRVQQERIKELENGLVLIRKSTEIMEARRIAKQALKGGEITKEMLSQ